MPVGYKGRRSQAVLTISASGPEFSAELEQGGRFLRPRVAADLRYTTADVDFLESWFGEPNHDSGEFEVHRRLRNPLKAEVLRAIQDVEKWLGEHREHPDWDGGGILFCYAGHGREYDGALVFEDDVLTPTEFAALLADAARRISPPGRLRVSAVLDSCHSGAFTMSLIHACFDDYSECLVPFHVFASCMEDEVAWEESSLGHGIYSYCFSVREHVPFGLGAMAIQPDNSFGPSLSIAGGELGCALMTAGAQNPVAYWNGTGEIEVGKKSFNVFEDGRLLTLDSIRLRVRTMRDEFAKAVAMMRPNAQFLRLSDAQMRASIAETLRFLREQKTRRAEGAV